MRGSVSDFEAQVGAGPWGPAIPARDIRRHPANDWLPTPKQGFERYGWVLVGVASAGALLGFWATSMSSMLGRWGLAGLCPGPVVASIGLDPAGIFPFLAVMLVGLKLGVIIRARI